MANPLMTHLEPKAVDVIIHCRHLCMESRGILTQGEEIITSTMLDDLLSNLALRTAFLALTHVR
jgi:GTP cyclohydrolase I